MSPNNLLPAEACIYCGSNGPFSAEHVIPAGLGGDDKRFMLRGMVCKKCNTDIFSPLELEFLRKSPAALGRIFLQPEGRRRGKGANPPKLEASAKEMITPAGYAVEIELGARGRPTILPQLVLVGDREGVSTGSEATPLREYIDRVQILLGASVVCVSKVSNEKAPALYATTYVWNGDQYVERDVLTVLAPPDPSVWSAPLKPNADGSEPKSRARMFLRGNGQIVLKSTEKLGVARALTFFRKLLNQTTFEQMMEQDIENPLVGLSMSFDIAVTGRVLAKVGMNLLAHIAGADYVRHPQFQRVKRSIATGTPAFPLHSTEQKLPIANIFSGLPHTLHGFMIAGIPRPGRTFSLMLNARLYGSQIESVLLGEGLPYPNFSNNIFFTVDYEAHRIERYEMMDFVRAFPFNFSRPSAPAIAPAPN
jgi:hypothetical protein